MADFAILMIGTIGFPEIVIIFLIILLLFGAKRLPEIARSLGKAISEFKKTKDDIMNYDETPGSAEKTPEKIEESIDKEKPQSDEKD